jgi:hypothetical protein
MEIGTMAQIVWLILLLLRQFFGVDTSALATFFNALFGGLGA